VVQSWIYGVRGKQTPNPYKMESNKMSLKTKKKTIKLSDPRITEVSSYSPKGEPDFFNFRISGRLEDIQINIEKRELLKLIKLSDKFGDDLFLNVKTK